MNAPTMPEASENAAAPEILTIHQYFCDPTISPRAKALLAILSPYIHQHGFCAIFRRDFAQMLGCCGREITNAFAELEKREILKSQWGGQGKPKRITFGRAVAFYGGSEAITVSSHSRAGGGAPSGGGIPRHDRSSKDTIPESPSFFDALDVRACVAQLGNLDQSLPYAVDQLTTTTHGKTSSSFFAKKTDVGYGANVERAAQRAHRRKRRRRGEVAARGLQPIVRRLTSLNVTEASAIRLALDRTADEIDQAIAYTEFKRPRTDFAGYLVRAIIGRWKLAPHLRRQIADADRELQSVALQHAAPPSQVAAAQRAIAAPEPPPDTRTDAEYYDGFNEFFKQRLRDQARAEITIAPEDPTYAEELQRRVLQRVRSYRSAR